MQNAIVALLLAAIFSFFVPSAQKWLRGLLRSRPGVLWAVPFVLTAIFCVAAVMVDAFSIPLLFLVLVYTAGPVLCVYVENRTSQKPEPRPLDFVAILLLWLPIEFAAGHAMVPRPVQGFLHSVAYGIAILLGLIVFLGFRSFADLKYNLPRASRDYWLPFAGFAILAPVLVAIGMPIGFLPPPHLPARSVGGMAGVLGIIFVGTALPEEILFRSLIQDLLMQRLGNTTRALLVASLIFGAAHLDNGPQAVPNWRYMILATIAGFAYGKVFQKSTTVLSSAVLHTMVDWTKHIFF